MSCGCLLESSDWADEYGIVLKAITLVRTEIIEFNRDNWTKVKIRSTYDLVLGTRWVARHSFGSSDWLDNIFDI